MKKIVLASASPRRRELIRCITDNVLCVSSTAEEILPDNMEAAMIPEFLAKQKAQSVADEYPDHIIIGCDTIVLLGDEILTKPESKEDAYKKLRTLSGKKHRVITGCCVIRGDNIKTFSEETQVEFYELSDEEIYAYIETSEPMDKAGAYGIQGKGSLFVKGIEGDYFNVVGLPIAKLYRELNS